MVENKWSQTVVYSPKLPLLQPPPLHNSVMRRVPKDEIAREMNAPLVVIMVVAGAREQLCYSREANRSSSRADASSASSII